MSRFPCIRILYLLFPACMLMSCVKDVDFDQVNEFEMSPVVESSLVYSTLPVPVWDSIPFTLTVSDTARIELFSNSFSVDNLQRAELYFETLSTVSQSLSVEMHLLDDNYTVLDELSFSLPAASEGEEEQASAELVYDEDRVNMLTDVTRVIFYVTIPDFGNRNEEAYVKLRSRGTFYLYIE
ncbi:hypothetical protein LS482_04400 [Sinomicrobium kalidii]|uniref:hypothetical protein n=1 Tax=Sinomicrobium kalidii TaxID=2900738 RepID=UPI001E594EF3|nr:hypothetical protein [Sinomicrobium kalidii]UGU17114.1 hypothetical protein LS482_04400 [Sinomicrobium kalidii]